MKFNLAIALCALTLSGAANATLTGVQVNGTLTFNGGATNFFDPTNGLVPAGYGNSTGQPVTIGSGIEFAFQDPGDLDTANFSATQLTIGDLVLNAGINKPVEMTFTTLTPGAFGGLSLVSSNIPGLTYGVSGDTITIDWPAANVTVRQTFQAVFDIAPGGVPEPATWAMMLFGFGAIGLAVRRNRTKLSAAV